MMQTDRPEWVNSTPKHSFKLVAFDDGGDSTQEVELTVEEYEALKAQLAESRGIPAAKEVD